MEEHNILLKDLCARLPYGVKVYYQNLELPFILFEVNLKGEVLTLTDDTQTNYFVQYVQNSKPYLRPMPSMTEEEKEELNCLCYHNIDVQDGMLCGYICAYEMNDVIDWLNKNMFDYRGLIEKGLAIEVTEDNNPYEN